MVKVNILNSQVQEKAEQVTDISERDFWRHYLTMLNVVIPKQLSNKEVEVMSLVLSKAVGISYFSKPYYRELKDPNLKLSVSEIGRLKDKFIELGLLESKVHTKDKRKRIILPVQSLLSLQKYIKESKKISLIFAYNIIDVG